MLSIKVAWLEFYSNIAKSISRIKIRPIESYMKRITIFFLSDDFTDFCRRNNLTAEEVIYFGDDLPDIPVMKACGCGVCPADAVEEAKEAADFISGFPGGKRCVRNTLEMVMKIQGQWILDVQDYKRKF